MSGKKKTTFAKMARERKLRERRVEKQARKDARKQGLLPRELDETPPFESSVESAEPPHSEPGSVSFEAR